MLGGCIRRVRWERMCHLVLVVIIVSGLMNVLVDDDDDGGGCGDGAKRSFPACATVISSLPSSSVCCSCKPCIGSVIPIG